MIILHSFPASLQRLNLPYIQTITHTNCYPPFSTVTLPFRSYHQPKNLLYAPKPSRSQTIKAQDFDFDIDIDADVVDDAIATDDDDDEFSPRGGFRRDGDEKDYDRDPEFAEILGSCLDDPEKAQSKMEERLRSKRNKILHTKTGSALPMNVIFNKFGFSNSYIWFEFYNAPLGKDISLICNTIRSWHIVGRLGGCNSMNMQLSQSLLDKRPSYDAIQGANVTPTTFYNIGDLEIQDNLARIWVDIGTSEPLLLDVLINALTQISSDYIGIKQLVFGGSEFENWKENMTSEAAGYSVHLIQTITNLLTSPKPQLQHLTQYIPHLTPPLIFTIFSSKSLSSHPINLLSFFKWSQTHLPFFSSTALPSLLALLSSLFRHNKFPDAKSLLVDFISVDRTNTLHHSILHPSRFYPEPSKALYDTAIGAYIYSGKPHLAAQIFKKMKRLRLCPNLLTCNTLLISLVRFPSSHSVSMSREIFNDVVRLGVIPNATTFNILINGYCLENKFKDALEVLRSMRGYKCTPDVVSYNTILDALCKKGRLSEARDLLLDMKNRGLLPKRNTYNILVYGYCKLGWLKDAAKVIELMTLNNVLPDIWTYNMLISGFCNGGRIDEAIRLRDEMVSMKLMPDVVTYNTLINACFEWRDSSEASKLLEEMLEKGVKQNAVTQNILVKWYCKEGKMDEASDTVRKMEENGFSPDSVTYNTLINGYCKAGNLGEAFRIMDEMGRKGLKMDAFTLNTFLHTLCGERKLKEAYSLLNGARNRGYVLDEVSYGTLIMGYFKDENVENALKIWDEMKDKEIIPSIVTYNSIIGGLCKSGRSEQAITKLNELLENGLFPDETTYNTIIHGYCLEGEVEKAFQFHNKMVENSFRPDVFTCNILLRGLCREGMLEKALKLFNTWISKGKAIDTVTYNILISSLCKEGKLEEAFDLLAEMEENKLGPDHYTVNSIFSALTDAGKIKEAEEFMSKMTETGKLLNQSLQMDKRHELASSETPQETDETSESSSERVSELCTEGRYKDAMLIFEDMAKKGISVNKSTYISLMDGLIKRRKSISKAAQQ